MHARDLECLPCCLAEEVAAALGVVVAPAQAERTKADTRSDTDTAAVGIVGRDEVRRLDDNVASKEDRGRITNEVTVGRDLAVRGHGVVHPALAFSQRPT